MNANMATQGKTEGLEFRFTCVRVGNTFDAHRLIHFAASHDKRAEIVERLFTAYFADGATLGDQDTLVRLASDIGPNAEAARAVLESKGVTEDVRADEERARAFRITAVPFFAIYERYGVSGAQPPELLLEALQKAWSESASAESIRS